MGSLYRRRLPLALGSFFLPPCLSKWSKQHFFHFPLFNSPRWQKITNSQSACQQGKKKQIG